MSKTRKKSTTGTSRQSGQAPAHKHSHRPRFSKELSVLYEDDAVVVVNKPAGLLAVPIKGSHTPSAQSLVSDYLKPKKQRALIVHRIDRFVSGLLLFAKNTSDREALIKQFLEHTPRRKYLAVVRGRLNNESGTLVHYFRKDGMFQQLRTAKDPLATRAELHYSVEQLFADATLVSVELVTGLQNQIRAQFSAEGCPVIGDRKYHRQESDEPLIDRVALHAAHLQFIHPRSGESVSFDCEMPADLKYLVQQCSKRR